MKNPDRRFPLDWPPANSRCARLAGAATGSGIPAGDDEERFDPFFARKFIGRGLGLPAIPGVVQTPREAVMVRSKTGEGNTFRFFLPTSSAGPSPETEPK